MNKKPLLSILATIMLTVSVACSLSGILSDPTATPVPPTPIPATETPLPPTPEPTAAPTLEPTPEPTAEPAQAESQAFDPCILLTASDAETLLGEPAGPATTNAGACYYMNASDSLYTVSLAAAQGTDQLGIYQGQFILFGFSGGKADEATLSKLRLMAEAYDSFGFFSEIVRLTEGSATVKAKLIENTPYDLAYWSWLTVDTRVQAALVVVRGKDMVNLNLVLPASKPQEEVQAAALALMDGVLAKLPAEYSLTGATQEPASDPTPAPTPTYVTLLPPTILNPQNGQIFSGYPRNLTLDWEEVTGAVSYEVQLEACDQNGQNCFNHPATNDPPRITQATEYSFSFVGNQPGRWRVRAFDSNGVAGEWSSWWTFRFTK